MAAIVQLKRLANALVSVSTRFEHAWLDDAEGLVVGVFPTPEMRFDFAIEALVPVRPGSVPEKRIISLLGQAKRVVRKYEIETGEAIYTVGSATQMLIEGLNIIEEKFPGTLEKLSDDKKRTKRPVARNREDLYDVPHPHNHSAELKSGYFVATNNKDHEARGFLRSAAEIAGLEWDKTFIVRQVS